jgi:hypothetical protein
MDLVISLIFLGPILAVFCFVYGSAEIFGWESRELSLVGWLVDIRLLALFLFVPREWNLRFTVYVLVSEWILNVFRRKMQYDILSSGWGYAETMQDFDKENKLQASWSINPNDQFRTSRAPKGKSSII